MLHQSGSNPSSHAVGALIDQRGFGTLEALAIRDARMDRPSAETIELAKSTLRLFREASAPRAERATLKAVRTETLPL